MIPTRKIFLRLGSSAKSYPAINIIFDPSVLFLPPRACGTTAANYLENKISHISSTLGDWPEKIGGNYGEW